VTILMVVLIVYTLLRWIDHLSKLGRVGETIDRVETAAIEALERRARWPFLGGAAYPAGFKPPPSAATICSVDTGYVQHLDVGALGIIAKEHQIEIYVEILPGSFIHPGAPVARIVGTKGNGQAGELDSKILAALTVGLRRTFDQDPRFGLSVLAEIASRALSPATNDSGTVIDVVGRGVRCFSKWAMHQPATTEVDEDCLRVHVRPIEVHDLFDDFFTLIARDGAGLLEVDIRLIKALISLSEIAPELFMGQCQEHAALLLKRAQNALQLDEEKDRLRALARALIPARNEH